MEEADRILIDSLISIGLEVDDAKMTLEEFTPDILINATSLCLEYIFESKNEHQSFPKSCPVNMASRYKVGQALSEAIKSLGYNAALGYQSFLYPNVRESRNIISFLVENLPKDSGPSVVEGLDQASRLKSVIKTAFSDNWKSPWLPFYCRDQEIVGKSPDSLPRCIMIPFAADRKELPQLSDWFDSFPGLLEQFPSVGELLICAGNYERRTRLCERIDREALFTNLEQLRLRESAENSVASGPEVRKRTKFLSKLAGPPAPLATAPPVESEPLDRAENAAELAEAEYNALRDRYEAEATRFERLCDRLDRIGAKHAALLERARETASETDSVSRRLQTLDRTGGLVRLHGDASDEKLRGAIAKRESQLEQLERQWSAHRADLVARIDRVRDARRAGLVRTSRLESLLATVRDDMETCRADYVAKETEIRALDDKVKHVLATGPKSGGSRGDFTRRILELTENRKKQAGEVRRILADIFELHRELNSLRGKLDRSFADTSRSIGAVAKRDEAARRMHRALLGIHDNCASLVAVIEEKGRLLREVRELETSIAAEDADTVDKNLATILADQDAASASCVELKRLIKRHKAAATS